uniref:Uncharacterized protein n=1 Tax=Rhizophora mucronata TaxID=61149 RepID=A0A2P2P3D5_RHIMU
MAIISHFLPFCFGIHKKLEAQIQ